MHSCIRPENEEALEIMNETLEDRDKLNKPKD